MISSMTPYERANPDILDRNRKYRIAKGSGISFDEIGTLINNFKLLTEVLNVNSSCAQNILFLGHTRATSEWK